MDSEKVFKGLEWILEDDRFGFGQGLTKPETDEEQAGCFIRDALALLKEQQRIIEQYQKADGFLFAHGWKWENYIDTREEPHPIEVGEDGLPY